MMGDQLVNGVLKEISTGLAFARISPELVIVEASNNFNFILRINNDDTYIGRHLTEVFWEFVGSEEHLRKVQNGEHRGYKLERINRQHLSSDQVFYLDLKLSPLGENSELLLLVEDATAFGRLEQAIIQERNELRLAKHNLAGANARMRQLDHLKSLFFSMAAHDLRAPLMVIHGYADLLKSMLDDVPTGQIEVDTAREFIDTIRVQSNWLDNIIHNLIDLNRIDSDQLNLDLVKCDINAFVREAVEIMSPMARLNTLELQATIPEEPADVLIDPQRIQQILQNLIGNAIKYTQPNGKIAVDVQPDTNSGVEVNITDNGRGMTKAQLDNVFQLYYRTDDARRSEVRGSGLGLFIVRTLVEAHNGTVGVDSEEGKGSTFRFWLPHAAAPTSA